MGSLPDCANCINCSSSCSVNSCLIILRLASLCLASGERICLRSACFCDSYCCSALDSFCSSVIFCCMAKSFFRRMPSSSSSDISFALILREFGDCFRDFFLQVFGDFLEEFSAFGRHFSALCAYGLDQACCF